MTTVRSLVDRVAHLRGPLVAGFVDSALASLGTFAIGLYATRYFEPAELGAYAVFFGAFLLVIMVPAELIYRPTEVVTVRYPKEDRLGVLGNSLAIGAGPSILVAVAFSSAALVVPSDVPFETLVGLAVTTAIAGLLSPAQDHVRRMFHQAGRSSLAAAMSAIQLGTSFGALVLLDVGGVARSWIPLGALAIANVVSLTIGLVIATLVHHGGRIGLDSRALYRTGGWLVVSGFALIGGQVAGIVLTTILAGSAFAGYAQAAIILAQPLFVVSNGLGSVLNPVIMEAAGSGDERRARTVSRMYASLMVASTAGLVLLIGFEWPFNLLTDLFPNAYAINGLLAFTIVAQGLNYTQFGKKFELIGGVAHTPMAKATVVGSFAQVVVGAFAAILQAFTVAWGIAVSVVVKEILYRRALRFMYRATRPSP